MNAYKKLTLIYKRLRFWFYKKRAAYRKLRRLLFPSPAEVQFIRIMGGKAIIIDHIKDRRTGFPLTYITSVGKILERERLEREVRAGAMYIDFGVSTPYYKKGIEIDGKNFHQDITKEQERDDYVKRLGWKLLHIQAESVYREPNLVQRRVLEWLAQ